jgi:hypothetical protein
MADTPHEAQGLIKVASAQNESEAEFIQGILEAEGVRSMVQRSAGSDVPDFLSAGRRDVLVDASQADVARDALLLPQPGSSVPPTLDIDGKTRHGALTYVLVAVALVAILAWCATEFIL